VIVASHKAMHVHDTRTGRTMLGAAHPFVQQQPDSLPTAILHITQLTLRLLRPEAEDAHMLATYAGNTVHLWSTLPYMQLCSYDAAAD
jgi:hypothetical protein